MTAAPDPMMQGGLTQVEKYAGGLTPEQKTAVNTWLPQLRPGGSAAGSAGGRGAGAVFGIGIDTVDVMRQGKSESLVSFYPPRAACTFLLFSLSGATRPLLSALDS